MNYPLTNGQTMIVYVVGEHYQSPARVLVNPVNTVGVMGSGHAFDFKRFFPDMFTHYQDLCQQDRFNIGELLLYKTPHKWILNFPEKGHFRANVRAEHIADGLKKFAGIHSEQGITSASFPALGQDDDKLDWDNEIRPMMEAYLNPLPILVYVHLNEPDNPYNNPKRNIRSVRSWLMGQTRHITFDKFWRDIKSIVQTKPNIKLLDSTLGRFHVGVATGRNKRGRNLVLRINETPKPVYLSQSLLIDLWNYVTRTGYVLPHNLPNELDKYARYIVPLLSQLHYVDAVQLWTVGAERSMGLHYIPPLNRQDDSVIVELA
jgi:O-acetyl-ADP-ribose deacetylase (regulator of RNase III)